MIISEKRKMTRRAGEVTKKKVTAVVMVGPVINAVSHDMQHIGLSVPQTVHHTTHYSEFSSKMDVQLSHVAFDTLDVSKENKTGGEDGH